MYLKKRRRRGVRKILGYQPSFFALSLISVKQYYLVTSVPHYSLPAFFLYMGRQVRYPSTLSTTKQGDCYYSNVALCPLLFCLSTSRRIPTTNIERRRVCFSSAGGVPRPPSHRRSFAEFSNLCFRPSPVKYPPFCCSSKSRDGLRDGTGKLSCDDVDDPEKISTARPFASSVEALFIVPHVLPLMKLLQV